MKSWLGRYMRGYLPAYVNATLGPVQKRLFERWLSFDDSLNDELDQLAGLRSAVQSQPLMSPDPFVLRRIMTAADSGMVLPRTTWRPSLVWPAVAALLVLSALLLWRALPPGLEISWSLEGATPESFRVYRAPVDASANDDFSLIGELPAQTGVNRYGYTDLRLVPGQQFVYQVEAVDGSGNTVTSQALIGNSLEALPRQLLFLSIFTVISFAIWSMLRQYRSVISTPAHLAL